MVLLIPLHKDRAEKSQVFSSLRNHQKSPGDSSFAEDRFRKISTVFFVKKCIEFITWQRCVSATQDVVDLMHSAYTSKVAISGIASLESGSPDSKNPEIKDMKDSFKKSHLCKVVCFTDHIPKGVSVWSIPAEAPFRAHGGTSSVSGVAWHHNNSFR